MPSLRAGGTPAINEDWNFEVLEEGRVLLHEDALDWPTEDYRAAGAPVAELPIPPEAQAFLIGHVDIDFNHFAPGNGNGE